MKLGKRLKQIEQMVTSTYTHIWDCCCDHGLLGARLLSRSAAQNIHFVDIVSELMTELESKLQRFYPLYSSQALPNIASYESSDVNITINSKPIWKTHCIDVAQLPLAEYEGTHLIIIAGVGGDLMIKFIESICQKHPHLALDFLLCPVHHQFLLRQTLIQLDFGMKHEVLVEENHRFYEILYVSRFKNSSPSVHPVGRDIWTSDSDIQKSIVVKYLQKTLNHYQRVQQGNKQDVQSIINAYMKVVL